MEMVLEPVARMPTLRPRGGGRREEEEEEEEEEGGRTSMKKHEKLEKLEEWKIGR